MAFHDQTNDIANPSMESHSFRIEFENVPTAHRVNFKGMITSFSDQYTSNWNSQDVYGRMDPIMTFQRTGRVINFSFDVVAASMGEAIENHANMSALIQMLYPLYKGHTMTASPFMKIYFNNLIKGPRSIGNSMLGTLGGINYEPDLDVGVFADEAGNIYPKVLRVACSFTVIHPHKLGYGNSKPENKGAQVKAFPYGTRQGGSYLTTKQKQQAQLEMAGMTEKEFMAEDFDPDSQFNAQYADAMGPITGDKQKSSLSLMGEEKLDLSAPTSARDSFDKNTPSSPARKQIDQAKVNDISGILDTQMGSGEGAVDIEEFPEMDPSHTGPETSEQTRKRLSKLNDGGWAAKAYDERRKKGPSETYFVTPMRGGGVASRIRPPTRKPGQK